MKLYYSKGACSLAVRIVLHEMKVPCTFEAVNLKTKQTETGADYLKINPKGSVPALLLEDQELLTENAVIQQYLADSNKALLPPIGDFKRYRALEWLNFVSTDLHKGFGPLFNPKVPEAQKEEIFKPNIKRSLILVEQHLTHSHYLLGDQFTLADGYLFVLLTWLAHFKMDISEWPNLSRYFDELKKRPSVQKALEEEGLPK